MSVAQKRIREGAVVSRGILSCCRQLRRPHFCDKRRFVASQRLFALVLVAAIVSCLLGACASSVPASPVERLQERFAEPWSESTYMIATVDTPQGLWNVYVVSIPPDQIAIRQSRQNGEFEFGMIGDLIWHTAFGQTEATELGTEWIWFMRSHELFRFSEWISELEFENATEAADSLDTCSPADATDRFGLKVTLCIDSRGDPEWIERRTPRPFGENLVRIDISRWGDHQNKRLPFEFQQRLGDQIYSWVIQSIFELPPDQRLTPPSGISTIAQ